MLMYMFAQRSQWRLTAEGKKRPLDFRGLSVLRLIPLILRNVPPELAPFPQYICRGVAGLHRAVSLHLSG
jgi:hypothetical protein